MLLPLLLLAAAQAAPSATVQRPGKPFMSPMGEPVFGRHQQEDGLVAWFAETDLNHDNVLTADEMAADAQHFFEELDVDHDGEIGPEEIERYETQIAPQVRVRTAMSDVGGSAGGASAEADAGRYGLLQIPEPVMAADANFNRGISAAEFHDAAIARFQLLDFNHSGTLTLPQLQAIRQSAISAANRRPKPATDTDSAPGVAERGTPQGDR
jgi:Ca2+-binding EF-hand superfamily protein